jgi:DNA-binding LytR/AlgR family response regulator
LFASPSAAARGLQSLIQETHEPTCDPGRRRSHAAPALEELLAAVWPELEIVASVGDGIQALATLQRHRPDLMFLDVEMPEMSGIEVARHASGKCHVAFVTAYSSYATQAFDAGAVDYVLKPVNRERLAVACKRLQERLATALPADLEQVLAQLAARVAKAKPYLRWITASRGANVRMITIEEVCYFQADTKYILVALADGESLIHIAVRDLLEQLDPQVFCRSTARRSSTCRRSRRSPATARATCPSG